MHRSIIAATSLMALAAAEAPQSQEPSRAQPKARIATAAFIDAQGRPLGKATLTQTPNGVLIAAELEGLPPGEHGFHIHEKGKCDPAGRFESAGGHFTPEKKQHGFHVIDGSHAGDLPNLFVPGSGRAQTHVFSTAVTLTRGENTLLDADGSSIVVHAKPDDYRSQPSGAAGERIACAVVKPG